MAEAIAENLPSRQVLDEAPGRAVKFLGAVYRTREIRAALEGRGYTPGVNREGWRLVHAVLGFEEGDPGPSLDPAIRNAVVTIDAWDEPNFVIARATLERHHPEQAKFVFENLESATGTSAVAGVDVFLSRLDALDKGRKPATRAADQAAVKTLASRGVDGPERKRLRDLVSVAQGNSPAPTPVGPPSDPLPGLLALKAWFDEWSDIARAVVSKREYLIRLGLAKRRAPKKPPTVTV